MPDTGTSKFLKTYSIFKAKDINNESIIEYKIQDIPEDRFDDAIRMLIEATKEEPLCASRNVYENDDTKNELVRIWTAMLKARLSVGCFKNDGEMVGLNVLIIGRKGEESLFVSEDSNIRDMMNNLAQIHEEIDIFTNFSVDSYLTSLGLTVNPAYRNRGIAKELLKARLQIMKNLGLTLTVTTFTAIRSQEAAKSVGFEEIFVATYEKLKERGFDFVNEFSDFYKIMAMKL